MRCHGSDVDNESEVRRPAQHRPELSLACPLEGISYMPKSRTALAERTAAMSRGTHPANLRRIDVVQIDLMANELASLVDPKQVVRAGLSQLRKAMNSEVSVIALQSPEGDQLDIYVSSAGPLGTPAEQGLSERIVAAFCAVASADPEHLMVKFHRVDTEGRAAPGTLSSLQGRPLHNDDGVFGLAAVGLKSTEPGDLALAGTFTLLSTVLAANIRSSTAQAKLQAARADLIARNEELDGFARAVSHDLKAPVRHIKASSQFLLEEYSHCLEEQGRDYLAMIDRAADRMKRLIEDLLDLSLAGTSGNTERIDVVQAVAEIVEGLGVAVEGKRATVHVDDGLPAVFANKTRIEQLFANLIGNAIKFTHNERPLVKVGVRSVTDGIATFYVQDNGIGIDPEHHERIFGVFQRLHRRQDFEGNGAGLAIVKRAVEAHGGRIWVESKLGAGTTFLFTLPLWTERVNESQAG